MSFDLSVHKQADDELFTHPPEDPWSKEFDEWMELCRSRTLYRNPLGAGDTIYRYWSGPAVELRLPLINSIYNSGLRLTGDELDQLEAEMEILERHWKLLDFTQEPNVLESNSYEDGSKEQNEISLRDHLRQRMGYLREGIQIAKDKDGVLTVG